MDRVQSKSQLMAFFYEIMTFTFNQCFHTERFLVSAQNHNVRLCVIETRWEIFRTPDFSIWVFL